MPRISVILSQSLDARHCSPDDPMALECRIAIHGLDDQGRLVSCDEVFRVRLEQEGEKPGRPAPRRRIPIRGELLAPDEACHANRDGDCDHADCPQLRDGEPKRSGRDCPLLHDDQGDEE